MRVSDKALQAMEEAPSAAAARPRAAAPVAPVVLAVGEGLGAVGTIVGTPAATRAMRP